MTREVELGTSGITVTWEEPTATDISGVATLVSRNPAPNTFFTVGTTPVTYIFEDASNNRAECIFNVVVTTGKYLIF